MLAPWKKSYDQPKQHIKKQRHYFANKSPCSQGYGFSSGHVWMWELDCEESWVPKNWCIWTVVLEKTLESPLDSMFILKEISPLDSMFILNEISPGCSLEGLMLKLKLQYFGHLMWSWLTGKDSCWEGLGAGGEGDDRGWDGWWHHRLDGSEFAWTPGVGDRQRGLASRNRVAKSHIRLSDWTELNKGLPRWLSGKEFTCQCSRLRRCRFNPYVRKTPWRKKWKPTPVFLTEKNHG